MAHGISNKMANIRIKPPRMVHNSGKLGTYVNPARDLRPGRRLRRELMSSVQFPKIGFAAHAAAESFDKRSDMVSERLTLRE